jgi:hypothetical protein
MDPAVRSPWIVAAALVTSGLAMERAGTMLTTDDWLGLRNMHSRVRKIATSNWAAWRQEGET